LCGAARRRTLPIEALLIGKTAMQTDPPRPRRKLAAILSADVESYARLMGADEAGTLMTLTAYRKAMDALIAGHEGRVVGSAGDSVLAEFASAVEAVECALEIQEELAVRNAALADDHRLAFRIGINLGDVIVTGTDLYGDGVNIAARLQALAEPGGVYVSGGIYDQVRGKLPLHYEFLGEQSVKNIAPPIRVYRVRRDMAAGPQLWPWEPPPAHRPAIAVLPFDNLGGDEATGRLADGITEDIITDLARFRDLDVIARNSTAAYKGAPVDIRQVGKQLNVGYVLEGSIQRQGGTVRVTGQLIDARTGAHVWSERWDRPAEDVFAVQTEVAEKVAAAVGGDLTMGQIARAELQRAKRRRPNDLTAYDYFQLGKESKATVSNIDQGIDYLTRAVTLDPQLARAYSVRAWLHNFAIMFGVDAATGLKQMVADAEKAVALDPQDCESLGTLAFARIYQSRWAEAEQQFRTSVEMCPANSHALILAAAGFAFIGKAAEGAQLADRALRLDPRMTPANLQGVHDAYYMAQRYEDTIDVVMRMPEEHRARSSWVFLAVSYARLGRTEEAAEAKTKLLRAFPTVSAERILNEDYVFARQEDEDLFVDGFRVAGLPVCMTVDEIRGMPGARPRAECEQERAKSVAVKS
jgi:TolB-like protein/class 3 adenylate cyclase/Tfp pilus assembly protein PilF